MCNEKPVQAQDHSGPMPIPFNEFISWLDSLKELYYLGEHVARNMRRSQKIRDTARAFQAQLQGLKDMSATQAIEYIQNSPDLRIDRQTKRVRIPRRSPMGASIGRVFAGILEEHEYLDTPFYSEIGLGWFWFEVPNPEFVDRLFQAAADTMIPTTDGLLGAERSLPPNGLRDGMAAVCYYDVGDLSLVFEDAGSAQRFRQMYPCESTGILQFAGGGWNG